MFNNSISLPAAFVNRLAAKNQDIFLERPRLPGNTKRPSPFAPCRTFRDRARIPDDAIQSASPRRTEISTKRQENTAPRAAPIPFASPPRRNFHKKTRKYRPARRPDPLRLTAAPKFPQKDKKIPPRAPPRSTAPHRRAPNFPQKDKKIPPRAPPRSPSPHRRAPNFPQKTRKYRPAHDVRGAAAADRSGPCFVCSRCVRSAR